jgi:uncharacterized protein YutE (UPF0331/DUF86 family)
MNYAAYCDALIEQMEIHEGLLVQLRAAKQWNLLERTAAERALQILCDGVIGTAKHASKASGLTPRSDAFGSIQALMEHHPCPDVSLDQLKGAVGMRNAIVHDYLNLDWSLVQQVIEDGEFLKLKGFVLHCCGILGGRRC